MLAVSPTESFEIVVIGGGLVGLATARALAHDHRRHVAVLEAEAELAAHQSGHNSGVIHSGLYYRPGSLKAQLCTAGREALYQYCVAHAIKHERCGKLVVAVSRAEQARLERLLEIGRANRLDGLRLLSVDEAKEREPAIEGAGALLVPQTGIVHFPDVAASLARELRAQGHPVWTGSRAVSAEWIRSKWLITTDSRQIGARHVVNCAGLQCDRVARLFGVEPEVRIIPFRGEFYALGGDSRRLVRHSLYPVPDPALPFLGVHVTRTIQGLIKAGPNAVLALSRSSYRRSGINLRDLWSSLSYPGFWQLSREHLRIGMIELHRSFSHRAFTRAIRRLVPEVQPADVTRIGCGVRAQAVDRKGRLLDDFQMIHAERSTHVLNAPSPAATASLAIGRSIAAAIVSRL
jgi:L-2-hydroxyglutarate oxidase